MCITHQQRTWTHESHTFYDLHSQANSWRQWLKYICHRREYRLQLAAMDAFRAKTQLRRTLTGWSERVPILRDLHLTTTLATEFYNVKLKQYVFQEGLVQFWAQTVGARRIASAMRIQRAFRSKRARKKLFVLHTKLKYQLDARVAKGLDTASFTVETLFQALHWKKETRSADLWVFALVSYPWQPVNNELSEIFNTVATNWRYLRMKRMAFGAISATETVPSSVLREGAEAYGDDGGGHEAGDDEAHSAYSMLSWLGVNPHSLPCIVAFWQGRSFNMMTAGASSTSPVMTSTRRHRRHNQRRFERVCDQSASPSLVFPLTTATVLSVMTWIDALQSVSHEATVIDLQANFRACLARRLAQQYREARRNDRARRLQRWFRNLQLKWLTRKRNRAALKLQRWRHATVKRRVNYHDFQSAMACYRHAASGIQRFVGRYFAQKRFKMICACLVMTAERFPNAPLCEECFGFSDQQGTENETKSFVLATLKCRDCTQALCASCFTTLHRSGKRMLHLVDRIEIRAMNDPSIDMCDVCEVAACRKLCTTCKPSSQQPRARGFCASCFERAHCDPGSSGHPGLKHRSRLSWWQSERFKTHGWSRAAASSPQGALLSTAQDIVAKYQWTTLTMYQRQQQTLRQAQDTQKEREDELFAIRMQHEAILRDAFDRYDSDHSSSIDRVEFKRMFREELCQPLKDNQIDDAMRAMDKSGDGKIQFDELLLWFTEGVRDNSSQVASQASDLLKDALRAKRTMRRYREKLNALMPPVGSTIKDKLSLLSPTAGANNDEPSAPVVSKVPGFPSVECLALGDYASKRKVFFRFLKEIFQLEWVEDDEAIIPIENARDVFKSVFLPRWNAGELTFDFYFDDEAFEFEGSEWRRCWDAERCKYVYQTRRKVHKMVTLVGEIDDGKRRTSSVKKSSRRKSSRKASQPRPAGDQAAIVQEVYEDVVEMIDPRRKQLLFEDAKRAFATADQDASGFIDAKEFHHLLTAELCEPISKSKSREIMDEIDSDKSGKIDFDEFFLWYATDKCQDYPTTPQMERVRAILKTRRRARTTALAAVGAGVNGGLKVKQALEEKLRDNQLARDCKGASAELVILLYEGFPKLLASKALSLHQQHIDAARVWLTDKQQEEQREKDAVSKERADRKLLKKRATREAVLKRKKRVAGVKKTMKLLFFGVNKKEAHAAKVHDALQHLDREIKLVDQQLSSRLIGDSSRKSRRSIT